MGGGWGGVNGGLGTGGWGAQMGIRLKGKAWNTGQEQ